MTEEELEELRMVFSYQRGYLECHRGITEKIDLWLDGRKLLNEVERLRSKLEQPSTVLQSSSVLSLDQTLQHSSQ